MRSTLTEDMQKEAIRMMRLGIKCAEIARRIGVSSNSVYRLKKKVFGIQKDDTIQGDEDLRKWVWLQENWHFKKKEPPKPKRKTNFHTPYNFESFKRKEESYDH